MIKLFLLVAGIFSVFSVKDTVIAKESGVGRTLNGISFQLMVEMKGCPGCDLRGINFNRQNFSGWDFSYALLDDATFCLANLRGTIFNKASLRNVRFDGADLSNAQFIEAEMNGVSKIGAYSKRNVLEGDQVGASKARFIALPQTSDADPGAGVKSDKAVPKKIHRVGPVDYAQ